MSSARISLMMVMLVTSCFLAACNNDDPDDMACAVKPAEMNGFPFVFDSAEISFGYTKTDGNGDLEASDHYFYESAEDFLSEPRVFGVTTWTQREAHDVMCCTWNYVRTYDGENRITSQVLDVQDVVPVHEEMEFDAWDSQGRPLRAFMHYEEDGGAYTCSNIMFEYEYDIAADTLTIRRHAGVDDQGGTCGGSSTVRTAYEFFPYVALKRERWNTASADVENDEPQSVFDYGTAETPTQEICL